MAHLKLSAAMEDYLKVIFLMQEEGGTASTVGLAMRLGVAAPSVTSMVKRLHEMALVIHSPYQGIELTPAGRAVAVEVVRHHRLIELYLAEFLDVPWERVHDEAERLEHVLSEDLESRMADKLGQPAVDPHGHPIPNYEGRVLQEPTLPLWEVPPGTIVEVARVSDRDPGLLAHLTTVGLVPGAPVRVVGVSPYSGTQTVLVDDDTRVIGADLARAIQVRSDVSEGAGR
jgi:DtxR family Mn-dependent transcriptional regulator